MDAIATRKSIQLIRPETNSEGYFLTRSGQLNYIDPDIPFPAYAVSTTAAPGIVLSATGLTFQRVLGL